MKKTLPAPFQFFVFFLSLLVLCSFAIAAEQGSPMEMRISQLRSGSTANRVAGYNSLIADRKILGEELVKMGGAKDVNPEIKELCIKLLGEYRIVGSIDMLLANLLFETADPIGEKTPETLYPGVGSLIKIGSPVPERIVLKMNGTEDESLLNLYAVVIIGIDGAELGHERLNSATSKSGTSPKSAKLKRLAEMVKQLGQ